MAALLLTVAKRWNNKKWISSLNFLSGIGYAIPGAVLAYTELCKKFSVPVIGLVQFGGRWNSLDRRLDGLPWSGWIPNALENQISESKNSKLDLLVMSQEVIEGLHKRSSPFYLFTWWWIF